MTKVESKRRIIELWGPWKSNLNRATYQDKSAFYDGLAFGLSAAKDINGERAENNQCNGHAFLKDLAISVNAFCLFARNPLDQLASPAKEFTLISCAAVLEFPDALQGKVV